MRRFAIVLFTTMLSAALAQALPHVPGGYNIYAGIGGSLSRVDPSNTDLSLRLMGPLLEVDNMKKSYIVGFGTHMTWYSPSVIDHFSIDVFAKALIQKQCSTGGLFCFTTGFLFPGVMFEHVPTTDALGKSDATWNVVWNAGWVFRIELGRVFFEIDPSIMWHRPDNQDIQSWWRVTGFIGGVFDT